MRALELRCLERLAIVTDMTSAALSGISRYRPLGALVLCLSLVGGCRIPLEENDWAAYDGPGAVYFQAEELQFPRSLMEDPLEPINRPISAFNYGLLYGVVQPFAWVYRHITPRGLRRSVDKAFTNALYPGRLVNNVLQGKWDGAKRETQRFVINTTVGVGGLFDPAKSKWEIDPSKEDLGQTFHKWGWDWSTYIVIPVLGPSTVRDGLGRIGDHLMDPLTYLNKPNGQYLQYYRVFNRLSDYIPGIVEFVQRNYDPYQLSKLLFRISREIEVTDYSTKSVDTGDTETLDAIFFKPKDSDWDKKGETHELELPNGKRVIYTAWVQDEPSMLMCFIPGTGGHRLGNSSLAISEIAFEHGRSVVTISSALNSEFIANTLSSAVPGFMPDDSFDNHLAFDAIYADLVERYSAERFPEKILSGLSLGAMTTLYIAAANADPDNALVNFDGYIPIDCPISLGHAVRTLDSFFNAPLQFPPGEREKEIRELFSKVLYLGTSGDLTPTEPMPFVQWEAQFLVGFSFRLTTIATIQQTQNNENLGVLKTKRTWYRRSMSYLECSTFSFIEYMYAFLLPCVASTREDIGFDDAGAERLLWLCNIQSLEEQLRGRKDIAYFSNRNDPLLRPQDILWVEQTLGDHAHFFEHGGHLGNMSQTSVQDAIRQAATTQLTL